MKNHIYLRFEKYLILFFLFLFIGTVISISAIYYEDNATSTPAIGGAYKEGLVGAVTGLNPLFAEYSEAEQDITNLVFSGLTKYDPDKRRIVGDIADYTISEDQKTYTFTLKENMLWHDGSPVTAADVLYTYKDVIQHPDFANEFLKTSFANIEIEATDERTITFTLPKPYAFFPSQVTIGLLPKHIWENTPLDQFRDSVMNKTPVGNGPYKIIDSVQFADVGFTPITRVSLERFNDYFEANTYRIQYLTFEVYPDTDSLIAHAHEYNGLKRVPTESKAAIAEYLDVHAYTLPQYVSLFLNTAQPTLKETKVRLGLRLGTPKDDILAKHPDTQRIDTPFLELDNNNWLSQFDLEKANGALYDAGWKFKEGESPITDPTAVPPTPIEEVQPETTPPAEETSTTEATEDSEEVDSEDADTTTEESDETTEESATEEEGTEENTDREDSDENAEENTEEETVEFYIFEPTKKETYATNKNSVQLKGTLPLSTTEVYVNDYQLRLYESGSDNFVYTASTSLGNLSEGENTFKVEATDKDGSRTTIDTITITYDPDLEEDTASGEEPTLAETPSTNTRGLTPSIPVRYKDNEPLIITLVTRDTPPIYGEIANELRSSWAAMGVDLRVELLDSLAMQDALDNKTYDILLFGQKLGYNLDAYPFWHSTQSGKGGVNFSNYQSFHTNTLLEEIRTPAAGSSIEEQLEQRQENLKKLQDTFAEDSPAIFLYQPVYYYAVDANIKGVSMGSLAYHKDRFSSLRHWYMQEKLQWTKPFSLQDLFNWLYKNLT